MVTVTFVSKRSTSVNLRCTFVFFKILQGTLLSFVGRNMHLKGTNVDILSTKVCLLKSYRSSSFISDRAGWTHFCLRNCFNSLWTFFVDYLLIGLTSGVSLILLERCMKCFIIFFILLELANTSSLYMKLRNIYMVRNNMQVDCGV